MSVATHIIYSDPIMEALENIGETELARVLGGLERNLAEIQYAIDATLSIKRKGSVVKVSLSIEPREIEQLSLLSGSR